MLKQRVLTALVLLALLLPTLWAHSAWPFMGFVSITMALAGWEWARLNGLGGIPAAGFGLLILALLASALAVGPMPLWAWVLTLASWVVGGAWVLRGASAGWLKQPHSVRLLTGVLALLPAGLALLLWKAQGLNALLSVFCLVWVADIAAYFGGRRFGRRKLAPAISPGKTWEGVGSGCIAVWALAIAWVVFLDPWLGGSSLYSQLLHPLGWPLTLLALLLLSMLSVLGDLFESLVKRAAGAKDSSGLLPGHGGVLDRVDALLPTLPAAWVLTELAQGLSR